MLAIGSDHAGFLLKEALMKELEQQHVAVRDFGTYDKESCDTADIAEIVAEAVVTSECEEGILVCGTGIGMSIAANKVPGIRAAVVSSVFSAKTAKEHNHANIICLGARVTGIDHAKMIVDTWLTRSCDRSAKRQQRLSKIIAIEKKYSKV